MDDAPTTSQTLTLSLSHCRQRARGQDANRPCFRSDADDFAQVAAPVLVAVTKSLERSPESQNVVVQLCDSLADRLRLQLIWPRSSDRFNDLTNAIYRACLEATSLESDEVVVLLRGLKVSGRRR